MSKLKENDFNYIFRIESASLALLALFLLNNVDGSLWLLAATFLLFDASAIGYIKNSRIGAITYNSVHNLLLPIVVIVSGQVIDSRLVIIFGCYWLFHVAVDRTFGYGLKKSSGFTHTHLGTIGKK
jgi:hypothetical protein